VWLWRLTLGRMTLFAPNLFPVMNTRRPQAMFIQQRVVFKGGKPIVLYGTKSAVGKCRRDRPAICA